PVSLTLDPKLFGVDSMNYIAKADISTLPKPDISTLPLHTLRFSANQATLACAALLLPFASPRMRN
ncbi:hypothetical protein, partial [Telluria aromaticivorans]|uniref:hypothetical protein n=1 Tax=Telluria aromaticivorans TaxID=2725995 RepID=UPI001BB2809D